MSVRLILKSNIMGCDNSFVMRSSCSSIALDSSGSKITFPSQSFKASEEGRSKVDRQNLQRLTIGSITRTTEKSMRPQNPLNVDS